MPRGPDPTALAPPFQAAGGPGGQTLQGLRPASWLCAVRPAGSGAETHQGPRADPELAGRVHATGGRRPHLEEGLSGPVRGSDLPTAWRLHPTKEDSDAAVGRAGVGAARWGRPGVDEPLTSHGLEAGLLQPRTPPWQSPERWSPAHLPLAPARPLPPTSQARPRPQHAGSHSPRATPTLFRSCLPWLPAPAPRLAGNPDQMLGQWPVGGGGRKWLGAVHLESKQGLAGLGHV